MASSTSKNMGDIPDAPPTTPPAPTETPTVEETSGPGGQPIITEETSLITQQQGIVLKFD